MVVQHTLRHLSRLSNTMLTEDACAGHAAGHSAAETVPEEEESPHEVPLQGAQYEEAAALSSDLAARLPRLNLAAARHRQPPTGYLALITSCPCGRCATHPLPIWCGWGCNSCVIGLSHVQFKLKLFMSNTSLCPQGRMLQAALAPMKKGLVSLPSRRMMTQVAAQQLYRSRRPHNSRASPKRRLHFSRLPPPLQ